MEKFDVKAYIEQVECSKDIKDCTKVPNPVISNDQNYIFISYAHTDYKAVYKTLAFLYASGVRFWYDDRLTAGKDWEKEAKEKLRSPNCSGAIFFLSENLFLSKSVINVELPCILGVDEKGESLNDIKAVNYFCVNITDKSPSDIIFDIMPELRAQGHGTSWLKMLVTAFPDETTYVSSNEKNYVETLLRQIQDNFNVIGATADEYDEGAPIYDGEYKDGKYHGKGKITFPENDIRDYYEGNFVAGRMQGVGFLRYKNGETYEGAFWEGTMHGNGKFTYLKGERTEPITDSPDCGHISQRVNRIYEGEWKNGMRDGNGVLISTMTGKAVYKGEWKNDKPNGKGSAWFVDHTAYEGDWKDGKPHGWGTYKEDGLLFMYCGNWQNGKQHGSGTMYWDYPNGSVEKGVWEEGKLIQPHE